MRFELNRTECVIEETRKGFEVSVLKLETAYKRIYETIGTYGSRTEAVSTLKKRFNIKKGVN
jgi:hypothetical protein